MEVLVAALTLFVAGCALVSVISPRHGLFWLRPKNPPGRVRAVFTNLAALVAILVLLVDAPPPNAEVSAKSTNRGSDSRGLVPGSAEGSPTADAERPEDDAPSPVTKRRRRAAEADRGPAAATSHTTQNVARADVTVDVVNSGGDDRARRELVELATLIGELGRSKVCSPKDGTCTESIFSAAAPGGCRLQLDWNIFNIDAAGTRVRDDFVSARYEAELGDLDIAGAKVSTYLLSPPLLTFYCRDGSMCVTQEAEIASGRRKYLPSIGFQSRSDAERLRESFRRVSRACGKGQ